MKKFLAMLLAMVMVLSLVACGGSSDEEAEGNYWDEAETMKLGVLAPLTGSSKETGDRTRWAVDYAVEQINAAGGVLGKTLEIEWFDIGEDQQGFITAMQSAVNTEGLSGTIGYCISSYTIGASDIILESEVPNISGGNSYTVRDLGNPYVWQVRMIDEYSVILLAKLGYEQYNIKNPAVVWATHAAGQSQHDVLVREYEGLGGTIAADIGYDINNTSDFTPIMTQVMNAGSDGLYMLSTTGADGILLAQTVDQFEWSLPLSGSSGLFDTAYLSQVNGATEGMFGIAEYNTWAETEGAQEYVDALLERDPQAFGRPGWVETCAYDSVFLFAEAAELIGSTDPKLVNEGLAMIKDYQGVMSSYSAREDRSFADYLWVAEIKNGEVAISGQVYRD